MLSSSSNCLEFTSKMFGLFVIQLMTVFVVHGAARVQDNLLKDLLSAYVRELKPDGQTLISHSITLTGIRKYDEGVLTADVYVNHAWNDNRLQWNPDRYGGITSLNIPSDLIWKPDVLLYNNAGSGSGMLYENIPVVLNNQGQVSWIPPMKLTSQCEEEGWIRKGITCKWIFGSWTYSSKDIDFINGTQSVDTTSYFPNSKFQLIKTSAVKNSVKYPCCPEKYSDLTYTLELKIY